MGADHVVDEGTGKRSPAEQLERLQDRALAGAVRSDQHGQPVERELDLRDRAEAVDADRDDAVRA
jgi:hypothetical protein